MTKSLILGISYVIPINEGIIDEKWEVLLLYTTYAYIQIGQLR